MSDNNRTDAASGLRTFFDHQVHFLHELMTGFGDDEAELLSSEDSSMVESFVDTANSRMRAVHDYAHQLRQYVRGLYDHILLVADEIPAPIDLNQEAFRSNALINSLFVNTDDIDKLSKTSPEMRSFLRDYDQHQVPIVYALLTAYRSEKPMLGIGLLGEMLVRDVPQQAVNFSAHQLHIPCKSTDELTMACKKFLFDRVVTLIKQDMAARVATQTLMPGDRSYESRLNSLANPNVYLTTLIEYLAVPSNLLRMDKTHLRLNKLGIKLGDDDNQHANEFDIHELTWSDNTRNVLLQVAYRQ